MKRTIRILECLEEENLIRKLTVEYKPSVVIAGVFESAQELGNLVENLGYEACYSLCEWPRDQMISFRDNYISGGKSDQKIAEGGNFVLGKDYLIFSEEIYTSNFNFKTSVNAKRKIRETLEDFFKVPIYSIESYVDSAGPRGHIDLTLLTIPQREMLIVDNRHYKQASTGLKQIAKAQNLELVIAKNCRLWALNCLVLDCQGSPVVIANEKTKPFLNLLSELKLDYVTVIADKSPSQGGSIRCRTNTAANACLFEQLGIAVRKKL